MRQCLHLSRTTYIEGLLRFTALPSLEQLYREKCLMFVRNILLLDSDDVIYYTFMGSSYRPCTIRGQFRQYLRQLQKISQDTENQLSLDELLTYLPKHQSPIHLSIDKLPVSQLRARLSLHESKLKSDRIRKGNRPTDLLCSLCVSPDTLEDADHVLLHCHRTLILRQECLHKLSILPISQPALVLVDLCKGNAPDELLDQKSVLKKALIIAGSYLSQIAETIIDF